MVDGTDPWGARTGESIAASQPDVRFPAPAALGLSLALPTLIWLTSFHTGYGYFIDELDYIACAMRPDFGYVDHPPLAPLLLGLNLWLLGDSLPAIRILPAICGATTMWLAAYAAARLGGKLYSQLLAALCVAMAPVFMGIFSFYSTNCFELLIWTLSFIVLLELSRSQNAALWLWVGALVGLGILFKHTSVVLAGAIGLGVLLSPLRGQLLQRQLWYGAGLALFIVLPNVIWQIQHDWASLAFYTAGDRLGNVSTPILGVLNEQIGSFNPVAAPIWMAGLWFLLGSRRGRPYRLVGCTMGVLFVALLIAGKSRPDRIMGVYPVLFAAGAVQLEAFASKRSIRWLSIVMAGLLVLVGVGISLLLLPILPPEAAASYARALGEENELQREVGATDLLLPLAHRMGSEELVREVARVYAELDEKERDTAIVLASGYAGAGALEVLAADRIPPVYSPHVTYYFWGPPADEPDVLIGVGYEVEQLQPYYARVEEVGRALCEYCMGWRQDVPITIAREALRPLRESWPELRLYGLPGRKLHLLQQAARQGGPADP
jgi:hypothetical protein